MKLHELSPKEGSRKTRRRVGRGLGSGLGKTSGRGTKGLYSRSGGSVRPGFEGGQMPLFRRLPKRGFKNPFSKEYATINVGALDALEANTVVNGDLLVELGWIHRSELKDGLKILGDGELTKALTVQATKFSKSAEEKIQNAGGKAEVI